MSDRITLGARLSGRVIGKECKTMARPKHQAGSLLIRGKRKKMYVARYYENVAGPCGELQRVRRSILLGPITEIGTRRAALNRAASANQSRMANPQGDSHVQTVCARGMGTKSPLPLQTVHPSWLSPYNVESSASPFR